MRIAILHAGAQLTEQQFAGVYRGHGLATDSYDIHNLGTDSLEQLRRYDIVHNLVGPSMIKHQREFGLRAYLLLLECLELCGAWVVNSTKSARADYDKAYAANSLTEAHVSTPVTHRVESEAVAMIHAGSMGFPLVVKPSMGGRGEDVYKVSSMEELVLAFRSIQPTMGCVLLQRFVVSDLTYDYRVCVCGGDVIFASKRSLVDGWLGSRNRGSHVEALDAVPAEVSEISIRGTRAIGAYFNCADVVLGRHGPSLIENNPTPDFSLANNAMFGFDPVAKIVGAILSSSARTLSARSETGCADGQS